MNIINHIVIFSTFLSSSFVQSARRVKSDLETNIYCSNDADCMMNVSNSHCNMNKLCQCQFQFSPYSSKNNGLKDQCNLAICQNSLICAALYDDLNTTCYNNNCNCQAGFNYDYEEQKCVYNDKKSRPLGSKCTQNNDCAGGVICTGLGYCQCSVGYISRNNITCELSNCDSDQFCRGLISANSKCLYSGTSNSYCQCDDDFKEDNNLRVCVPRAKKLGQYCNNFDPSQYCGNGVLCLNNICKCSAGWAPNVNHMDCTMIHCLSNFECMAQDLNSKCFSEACKCQDGYNLDYSTQLCIEKLSFNYLIIISIIACSGFIGLIIIYIIKLFQKLMNHQGI